MICKSFCDIDFSGICDKYCFKIITLCPQLRCFFKSHDEETKTEESAAGIAETIQEDIVDRVNHGLDQILQNLTLADLEESFQERQSGGQEMYYI